MTPHYGLKLNINSSFSYLNEVVCDLYYWHCTQYSPYIIRNTVLSSTWTYTVL